MLRDRFAFLGARWEAERLIEYNARQHAQLAASLEADAANAQEEARRTAQATVDELRQQLQATSQEQRVAMAALHAKLAAAE